MRFQISDMTAYTPTPAAFFSGTAIVDAYDKGRFPYPEAAIEHLATHIPENAVLLDMGAGNGRTLRPLFEAHRMNDVEVHAVDPSATMLASLTHTLGDRPNVIPHEGTFTIIPLEDESVDTVICGSSIHWGTTTAVEARQTRTELSRVLKPQGKLILLSDDWAISSPLARDLSQAQETIIHAMDDRGYREDKQALALRAQHHTRLALVKLRLTALSLKQKTAGLTPPEQATLTHLFQERVGEIFIHQNRLGGFFDHSRKSRIFRQSFDIDAQTLRDELHSHVWFDRMNEGQKAYTEDVLDSIIDKHTVPRKPLTAERACLVVVGHLKR